MAWTSLNNRINNLPKVIAGPILRRTEKDSVSVWIALQNYTDSSLQVTLKVYDGSNNIILQGVNSNVIGFGNNLKVCVVTATPVNASLVLQEGVVYKYNVFFTSGLITEDLLTNGVLSNSNYQIDISYDGSGLPSFSLPPSDINKLRVVHGSCRKPHGGEPDGKVDAFIGCDRLIYKAYTDSVAHPSDPAYSFADNRPHVMILTGDQIYADDVADVLLYMLQDAYPLFMGWDEPIPYTPNSITDLTPGQRSILRGSTGFSSTDDRSHLVLLGEFYAMYLFVWSDVFWPSITSNDVNDLPTHSQIYTGVYPQHIIKPDVYFNTQKQLLVGFHSTLRTVRKLLANVPSYMICDDHEITDDWNLNKDWYTGVFGDASNASKPLGMRIVQNGLAAYTVFQAWGNKPSDFIYSPSANTGGDILLLLGNLGVDHALNSTKWSQLRQLLLPTLTAGSNGQTYLSGGFDWHYTLKFNNNYQFIVLNTRTNRLFPSGKGNKYVALLSDVAIADQISSTQSKNILTFVIAPSPCFGSDAIERSLINVNNLGFRSRLKIDGEQWSYNKGFFETFLKELGQFSFVVLLSGDVHYGFSRHITYWDNRTSNQVISQIAQFVSSSLKNEKKGKFDSRGANRIEKNGSLLAAPSYVADYLGWNTAGKHMLMNGNIDVPVPLKDNYAVFTNVHDPRQDDVYYKDFSIKTTNIPHWYYRIRPVSDAFTDQDRTVTPAANSADAYSYTNGTKSNLCERNIRIMKWSDYRAIVGINNFGELRLIWNSTQKVVTQKFWYTPIGKVQNIASNMGAYTSHIIDFNLSETDKPGQY